MLTGVSYMGHHNPRHMATDLADIRALACDDVLLAAQENDFVHMTGKIRFFPKIARDHGLRPIAIFWGLLNTFGGGRSSQFLLDHPDAHQRHKDGSHNPAGCYNNPAALAHIQKMIDEIAVLGFAGYFVDEPSPIDCYCPSCRALFADWYAADLLAAAPEKLADFRRRCVLHYISTLCRYIKQTHPALETMCCLMPVDRSLWSAAAAIPELDNLGTDIYWVNETRDQRDMIPPITDLAVLCKSHRKTHHEWLQGWTVRAGKEDRILEAGRILISQKPAALYVWAYLGQIGTTESCDNPALAWSNVTQILREAKHP